MLGSFIASCMPANPPTAFKTNGSSKKEKIIVRIPWMKSVIMAAERPPAIPYITNITVIAAIATLGETRPPVLACTTALEPFSITPILIARFAIPTAANSIATLGLYLA